MALYSLGLMERLSNAVLHSYGNDTSLQIHLTNYESTLGNAIPIMVYAEKKTSQLRGSAATATVLREHVGKVFNPLEDLSGSRTHLELFAVEPDQRLSLRLCIILRRDQLKNASYSNTRGNAALYLTSYKAPHHDPMIKLTTGFLEKSLNGEVIATHSSHEPDVVLNYFPDANPTSVAYFEVVVDVTSAFCESAAHRLSVEDWRAAQDTPLYVPAILPLGV